MDLPRILILTDTLALADDLVENLDGLAYLLCRPDEIEAAGCEALVLADTGRYPPEQMQAWIDDLRRRHPHLPLLLVLESGVAPPDTLLLEPLELIWRPLRPQELRLRLKLLAERAPRSSAAEGFRQVFEKHHAMMLLIEPQSGQIVDANPAASRFYGYDRELLRQMRIQQINQLSEQEVLRDTERARTSVTNYFTFLHKLASGEMRTVEVHSTPVEIEGRQLLFSILHDITRRRRAEEALRQSEEQYRQLFELAPIGIAVADSQGRLLAFNDAILQASGFRREELASLDENSAFYPDAEARAQLLERFAREGFINRQELSLRRKDGSPYHALLTLAPIRFGGQPCQLALLEDITERKRKDERIQNALREREILLREIHHRVKNNFQVIISLLNMQCRKLQDARAVEPLTETRNRIRSMALIHEQIYLAESLADVDFGQYLQYLTRELYAPVNARGEQIQLSFGLERVLLDIDQAIPCGLLVNELLTNAFKYAFPAGWQGERRVAVHLSHASGGILLEVADTGTGMPADFDPDQPHTLGLQLSRQLVRQLDGSWELVRQGGTHWKVRFSVDPKGPV